MKTIITCLLAALGLTTACGQSNSKNTNVEGFVELIADTHRMDSLMQSLEYRFGKMQPWIKMKTPDNLQSVVITKPSTSMVVDSNASRFTMTSTYYPQSVFSLKDDLMFYKDYGWSNFVSDFFFGW